MERINHASAVDIGGGRMGFRSKDTVAGVPGTVVTATHMNAHQEEVMAVIEAAGLAPNGADFTQLLKSLYKLFPPAPYWMTVQAGPLNAPPGPPGFTPYYVAVGGAPTGAFAAFPYQVMYWDAPSASWKVFPYLRPGTVIYSEGAGQYYKRTNAPAWASWVASETDFGITALATAAETAARAIATKAVSPLNLGLLLARMGVPSNIYQHVTGGSYTRPANLLFLEGRLIGAGASGGSNNGTPFGGGGGNGSDIHFFLLPADIGPTSAFTIGVGGAAIPANTASSGNAGGNSTFATSLGAIGAGGGQGGGVGAGSGGGGAFGPGGLGGLSGNKGVIIDGARGYPGDPYFGIVPPTALGSFGRGGGGGNVITPSIAGGSGLLILKEYLAP